MPFVGIGYYDYWEEGTRLVWSRPVSVMVVTCRERVWRSVYVVVCLCRRVAEFVSGVGEVGSDCNR
jgi:hypothetical protein